MADDQELVGRLSQRLAEAQRRLGALPDDDRRAAFARRLVAVGNTAKRDLSAASRRLDALLRELDGIAEYPDR